MNTADLSALKPLAGIRVLEICNVAAGPFCALLLADLGADVIKLENPGAGDTLRAWPPHTGPENDRLSENFASLNRNKRSVTLDLKNPDDNAKAKNLIANADVLIENNRPGVMKRLGLDFDSAITINPKLIYCSISAYGQTGPRANEGGFDVTIQAMSGIMSVTGEPDGAPVKAEVRMMFLRAPGEPKLRLVLNLVRLSRGKMLGVDFNKDLTWVGGTVGIWPADE